MAKLEEAIIRKAEFRPYLWWRYTDTIFFIWRQGEEKLRSFMNNISKIHPTLMLKPEWLKSSITFLHVTASIAEGIIETDLYVKPTDNHQYLLSSSFHPFYCERGIPYREVLIRYWLQ